ncbi:MAG: AbrB/MazE/SpoVT family DNA-binding domain-containing protein [Candidatus Lutacidiplasmatales archaeon]|nr:AbrB/MazE/SpoVT family DNA-binding domain-containing protein [Thermoplasmata archaeon]MCI4329618.1 AbrB/MazE/SpoVT family DNA-binding domain-containing protein [Thermoplasmata archaeon]
MASGSGTISQKGQITVPKDVRDALGLHPGDRLLFDVEAGDRAVVRKARPTRLTEIIAAWGPSSETGIAYQRRVRNEWGERERRPGARRH